MKNNAEDSALKVRVCDTLPHGLTVASARGFKVSGHKLCASLGTLKVLKAKTLRFTARVGPGAAGMVTNTAKVTARNTKRAHARARVRVVAPPPPGKG